MREHIRSARILACWVALLPWVACGGPTGPEALSSADILGSWTFEVGRGTTCRSDVFRTTPPWVTRVSVRSVEETALRSFNLRGSWSTSLPNGEPVAKPADFTGSVDARSGAFEILLGLQHTGQPILLTGTLRTDGTATADQVWAPDFCYGMAGRRVGP